MNAPDYLSRLRTINQAKTPLDGTAQTAKTNLRGLCSSHEAHFQKYTPPDFDSEHFEERAAIYEFDAGFPRHEAERLARKEILKWTKMN